MTSPTDPVTSTSVPSTSVPSSTASKGPRDVLPYVVGIPVGMYAGAMVGMLTGLVTTWIGAFVIPAFLLTWFFTSRFIIRQMRAFHDKRQRELAVSTGADR